MREMPRTSGIEPERVGAPADERPPGRREPRSGAARPRTQWPGVGAAAAVGLAAGFALGRRSGRRRPPVAPASRPPLAAGPPRRRRLFAFAGAFATRLSARLAALAVANLMARASHRRRRGDSQSGRPEEWE